jgi:hypothetical protein
MRTYCKNAVASVGGATPSQIFKYTQDYSPLDCAGLGSVSRAGKGGLGLSWMELTAAAGGRTHRRELTCRVIPRHFDFLSVGEEFGADALGEHIA